MNNKELAIKLLDRIPESKMYYIIDILEEAAIPEEEPNAETIEAFQELENEGGNVFDGSAHDFLQMMLED
ncbi:MAG: hypothetical protein HFI05_13765 [Lachnospiraceae bacterium]|jgi:hypothetical protein|nr:hypothetical protein [Lachnospiraceae bacterium]